MTSKEYTIWLKGFAAAAGEFTLTPKQWDDLKDELNKVDDTPYVSDDFTIGPDGAYERDPNQFPFPLGTPNGTTITTTPGTGYITIANPNIVSFSSGSASTSNAPYPPMPGTTITYTTNGAPSWYTTTIANEKTLLND
jgi:hypothetical protein